jgi:Zn-dependent protease
LSLEFQIIYFALLLFSLSVHEAAHAWSADRLGDPTGRLLGRITLNPLSHIDWFGTVLLPLLLIYSGLPPLGWAKPVPVDIRNLAAPRRDFAIVAAAGPASNLIQAAIGAALFAVVRGNTGEPLGGPVLAAVLGMYVILNVGLALFNLLPVPPLDGGNVLSGLVPESVARMLDLLRGPVGFVLIYLLIWSGMLWRVIDPLRQALLGWLL